MGKSHSRPAPQSGSSARRRRQCCCRRCPPGVGVVAAVNGELGTGGTVGVVPAEGRGQACPGDRPAASGRRPAAAESCGWGSRWGWGRRGRRLRRPSRSASTPSRGGVDGEVVPVLAVERLDLEIPHQPRLAGADGQPHQARPRSAGERFRCRRAWCAGRRPAGTKPPAARRFRCRPSGQRRRGRGGVDRGRGGVDRARARSGRKALLTLISRPSRLTLKWSWPL